MACLIKWSPKSLANLENICNYIEKDSEVYAQLFAKKVISMVKAIPQFPKSGRKVPEYDDDNLREKIYKSYRIIYRLNEKEIEIVAICHGAMLLTDIL